MSHHVIGSLGYSIDEYHSITNALDEFMNAYDKHNRELSDSSQQEKNKAYIELNKIIIQHLKEKQSYRLAQSNN